MVLASTDASAAEPTNTGKRFRFHGELDLLSFTHFNPDGDGDNFNTIGFGFGKTTGIDSYLFVPSWALGFGYVILDERAVVGGRFVFDLTSTSDDDDDGFDDARATVVSGQLVPYFRYIFMPGKRARPFLEGRFGLGGSAVSTTDNDSNDRDSLSVIYPIVGFGGGAHIFIVDAFSLDLAATFDYAAPHAKTRNETAGVTVEDDDYDKVGDFINVAAQVGFSVWF
jgi:hypothetical protein